MDFPLHIITAAVIISTGKVFAAMEVGPKIWGKAMLLLLMKKHPIFFHGIISSNIVGGGWFFKH